jgi:hypothetical protein
VSRLPHPHIADRVEAFAHWLAHERPMPKRKVPPADDWNDWHYADAKPDWEDRNDEGETHA